MWQRAPKKSIEVRKDREMVVVIIMANFLNKIISPPKSALPQPSVVIVPLKILMPISE